MKFKKSDWAHWLTKDSLREKLEDYYIEFSIGLEGGWNRRHIYHFLHIYFHLWKFGTPQYKLADQIAQILKEEVDEQKDLLGKDTQYPRGN